MKIAHATLQSKSPYSQSRYTKEDVPMLPKEKDGDYEIRTWREKGHYDANGNVIIPPMAFKMALDKAAKMVGEKIAGKGNSTYSKFFVSGVLVLEPLVLPWTKKSVNLQKIHANADGVRGSGKRVWRYFPVVEDWSGVVSFHILADEITEDVFTRFLTQSGKFVGIGRFRPENGGFFGRFGVTDIKWENI